MTNEKLSKLFHEIGDISNNFELKPWTENIKLLKDDFDINKINSPQNYLEVISEIAEILRQTRLLFIYSVLNKVCEDEAKLYHFETPFQASMSYTAVMKKEGSFYLLDEDGHYRETFTSEDFVRFIDDQYWELFE